MAKKEWKPLISVILPVYNTEKYIAEAIDSVLRQTYPVSEVIVVDDGSTDTSADVVKHYGSKLKYLYQCNQGSASARNTGIRKAVGDFLAFLDVDDLWTENKIERQLHEFEIHSNLHIVFGNVEQFVSQDFNGALQSRLRNELKQMPGYHVGTMLIKKEAFYKVGFFNDKLQLAEFIDWFDRAKQLNLKYTMIDEVLMKRRIHQTNQGVYKKKFQKDYLKVLKAAIDRNRKQRSATGNKKENSIHIREKND